MSIEGVHQKMHHHDNCCVWLSGWTAEQLCGCPADTLCTLLLWQTWHARRPLGRLAELGGVVARPVMLDAATLATDPVAEAPADSINGAVDDDSEGVLKARVVSAHIANTTQTA
jgi:hypothetical protein